MKAITSSLVVEDNPIALKTLSSLLSALGAASVTEAESALATQLVATIETNWDPTRYRDTYHDDLLALIARKAQGETIAAPEPSAPVGGEVVDIMDLLKRSVEGARRAKAADSTNAAQAAGA